MTDREFTSSAAPHADRWCVSRCECGRIVLSLGTTKLEFATHEFAHLHRLLGEAMRQFEIQSSDHGVVRIGTVTH